MLFQEVWQPVHSQHQAEHRRHRGGNRDKVIFCTLLLIKCLPNC